MAAASATTGRSAARHIPAFDALRGYAIIAVLLVHCSIIMRSDIAASNPTIAWLFNFGDLGVQLFYIVSACTLFWSMASRTRADRRPTAAFFVRRFFRIAPMFWAAILIGLAVVGWGARYNAPDGLSLFDVVTSFLFVHGITPHSINSAVPGGWSIAVEMIFYLLVPLCFVFIKTIRHAVRFIALAWFFNLGAAWLYRAWMLPHYPAAQHYLLDQFLVLWLPNQLPVFGLGFLLFFLIKDHLAGPAAAPTHGRPQRSAGVRPDYWLMSAALLYVVYSIVAFRQIMLPQLLAESTVLMLLAWMLIYRPLRVFVNPVVGYLGKISYSLYLTHFYLIILITSHISWFYDAHVAAWTRYGALLGLTAGLSIIASSLTYFVIERPGIALGKRLIRGLQWGPPTAREPAAQTLPPAATAPL